MSLPLWILRAPQNATHWDCSECGVLNEIREEDKGTKPPCMGGNGCDNGSGVKHTLYSVCIWIEWRDGDIEGNRISRANGTAVPLKVNDTGN